MALKIFKFGGASIKDADSVRNVAFVLKKHSGQQIIVVVSAMGKITNLLETLADAFFNKNENAKYILEQIKKYHFDIIGTLFSDTSHRVYDDVNSLFLLLSSLPLVLEIP